MKGPTVVSPFLFSAASADAPSTLLQIPVEVIERRSNSYLNPIDGDPSSLEYSGTG